MYIRFNWEAFQSHRFLYPTQDGMNWQVHHLHLQVVKIIADEVVHRIQDYIRLGSVLLGQMEGRIAGSYGSMKKKSQ